MLSYFIHNLLPVVWMGSPDYGLRMRVWYVTSVLDSVYHKNRDGVRGGFEGYPHPVPGPSPPSRGPRPPFPVLRPYSPRNFRLTTTFVGYSVQRDVSSVMTISQSRSTTQNAGAIGRHREQKTIDMQEIQM